jgi:hypothetical protein
MKKAIILMLAGMIFAATVGTTFARGGEAGKVFKKHTKKKKKKHTQMLNIYQG